MEKAKVLERLIKEQGYSIRSFAQKCGMPESTLYTILKKGVGRASVDNIIIICQNLGIKIEEMEQLAAGEKKMYEPTYEDIQTLVARNGKKLTLEQKKDLIKILLSDDDD